MNFLFGFTLFGPEEKETLITCFRGRGDGVIFFSIFSHFSFLLFSISFSFSFSDLYFSTISLLFFLFSFFPFFSHLSNFSCLMKMALYYDSMIA